ncbi:MAG: TonB family protein [Azonexus sp.]|nr:TonB family protein [Betaproteobacteria bacterium]MBP6035290.1 TonB family protein [Azonexus sp.]MBP6905873.1 TonB family protein [Azonexus sp.]
MSAVPFASPQPAESRRLALAIGISMALHAALLTLHFQFPEASRTMREKALDIILVNAKSATKPRDPQALAQSNLDGGGNTDENRRAKTPLPPTRQQTAGSDVEQMQRRVQELEARQQQLLSEARTLRSATVTPPGEARDTAPDASGLDLAEAARAMARLEGEISKSVDEYSKRPRRRFIGARAEEYRFAQYIEDWRQKVERVGTLNYPDAARGKLYGSLVMTVSILADGSVAHIDISRSSGHKVLDDAARRIVQMASPYAAFPPEIRRDTDILDVTRIWYFTQGDSLESKAR